MIKPDWSKAPEWANWWAVDWDGMQFWYEEKPTVSVFGPWWSRDKNKRFKYYTQYTWHISDWEETLQQRPEAQQEWYVGQRVWDVVRGEGVVSSLDYSRLYPIRVKYENNEYLSYTKSGKPITSDKISSIYHYPVKIVRDTEAEEYYKKQEVNSQDLLSKIIALVDEYKKSNN